MAYRARVTGSRSTGTIAAQSVVTKRVK